LQLDLTGKSSDHGPWSQQMLATEEGRKLIAEASQKMLKLITLLPKVLPGIDPSTQLAPALRCTSSQHNVPQATVVDESLCYLSEVFGLIEPDPAAFSKGTWSEMFCHLAAQFAHAIILVDMTVPGLPITFCNNAFLNLTGYQMEDVVGQNCRFLQCDKTEPKVLSSLIAAVRSGMPFSGQITNAKRGGVVFENNLSLHPVYDQTACTVSTSVCWPTWQLLEAPRVLDSPSRKVKIGSPTVISRRSATRCICSGPTCQRPLTQGPNLLLKRHPS